MKPEGGGQNPKSHHDAQQKSEVRAPIVDGSALRSPSGYMFGDCSLAEHLLWTYARIFECAPGAISNRWEITEYSTFAKAKYGSVIQAAPGNGPLTLPPVARIPHFTNDGADCARALWALACFSIELLHCYPEEVLREIAEEFDSVPKVDGLPVRLKCRGKAPQVIEREVAAILEYLQEPTQYNANERRILELCRKNGQELLTEWWHGWQEMAEIVRDKPLAVGTWELWWAVIEAKLDAERPEGFDKSPRWIGRPREEQNRDLLRFGEVPEGSLGYQDDLREIGYAAAASAIRKPYEEYLKAAANDPISLRAKLRGGDEIQIRNETQLRKFQAMCRRIVDTLNSTKDGKPIDDEPFDRLSGRWKSNEATAYLEIAGTLVDATPSAIRKDLKQSVKRLATRREKQGFGWSHV